MEIDPDTDFEAFDQAMTECGGDLGVGIVEGDQ
jgi:hypothetical protein